MQVVAVAMQRPRRNGTPLTEMCGADGHLIIREVGPGLNVKLLQPCRHDVNPVQIASVCLAML